MRSYAQRERLITEFLWGDYLNDLNNTFGYVGYTEMFWVARRLDASARLGVYRMFTEMFPNYRYAIPIASAKNDTKFCAIYLREYINLSEDENIFTVGTYGYINKQLAYYKER